MTDRESASGGWGRCSEGSKCVCVVGGIWTTTHNKCVSRVIKKKTSSLLRHTSTIWRFRKEEASITRSFSWSQKFVSSTSSFETSPTSRIMLLERADRKRRFLCKNGPKKKRAAVVHCIFLEQHQSSWTLIIWLPNVFLLHWETKSEALKHLNVDTRPGDR